MEKNIVARMLQEHESFTKSEKKIVDYVLDHQKETQYISITDLGTACDVAVSTISVFCRKLGLAGFNDFKLELAKAALVAGGRVAGAGADAVNWDDPVSTVMKKIFRTEEDALNMAYHMLQESAVTKAAELLSSARQVLCLGQGNHSMVASIAWAQFSGFSTKFRTVQDDHLQSVLLATLGSDDVVLYFSYSGATHELIRAAEQIRARGAKLILVTRFLNAPAAAYAEAVLLCGPNEEPLQFGSTAAIVSQLYVVDVLVSEYCKRNQQEANELHQSVGKALTVKCV